MKKIIILMLCLVSAGAFADSLWDKSLKVFGQYYTEKAKKAYISMASSAPGKKGYIIEQWLEFKYENGKKYERLLKVSKNGVEKKLPAAAKTMWRLSKNKKKKVNKGAIEIFHADKQNMVKFTPTGATKVVNGKLCREYRYRRKVLRSKLLRRRRRRRRSKYRYNTGLAYVDIKTGAPLEIRMSAKNSNYMKKSKPSLIRLRFDGSKLYAYYLEMNMNISFFGQSKKLQSIVKMEY